MDDCATHFDFGFFFILLNLSDQHHHQPNNHPPFKMNSPPKSEPQPSFILPIPVMLPLNDPIPRDSKAPTIDLQATIVTEVPPTYGGDHPASGFFEDTKYNEGSYYEPNADDAKFDSAFRLLSCVESGYTGLFFKGVDDGQSQMTTVPSPKWKNLAPTKFIDWTGIGEIEGMVHSIDWEDRPNLCIAKLMTGDEEFRFVKKETLETLGKRGSLAIFVVGRPLIVQILDSNKTCLNIAMNSGSLLMLGPALLKSFGVRFPKAEVRGNDAPALLGSLSLDAPILHPPSQYVSCVFIFACTKTTQVPAFPVASGRKMLDLYLIKYDADRKTAEENAKAQALLHQRQSQARKMVNEVDNEMQKLLLAGDIEKINAVLALLKPAPVVEPVRPNP
jgi:hypothetical protein